MCRPHLKHSVCIGKMLPQHPSHGATRHMPSSDTVHVSLTRCACSDHVPALRARKAQRSGATTQVTLPRTEGLLHKAAEGLQRVTRQTHGQSLQRWNGMHAHHQSLPERQGPAVSWTAQVQNGAALHCQPLDFQGGGKLQGLRYLSQPAFVFFTTVCCCEMIQNQEVLASKILQCLHVESVHCKVAAPRRLSPRDFMVLFHGMFFSVRRCR